MKILVDKMPINPEECPWAEWIPTLKLHICGVNKSAVMRDGLSDDNTCREILACEAGKSCFTCPYFREFKAVTDEVITVSENPIITQRRSVPVVLKSAMDLMSKRRNDSV